ncbi:MAG: sigma-54-dependent Fis family transcriptional regulator [Acidobacteria bacterium]|nr:MAG: sigma-54-dependent Fis family transcriptional regulator [Acidobacteriota bacterium]
MTKSVKVLVVDDDTTFRRVIVRELASMGFEAEGVASGEEALAVTEHQEYDVVLLDMKLPTLDGMAVLKALKQAHPLTEVIMLTAYGTIDSAIRSIKLGAYDYLTKPCKLEELEAIIHRAGEKRALQQRNIILRQELARRDRFDEFVGRSKALQRILQLITKIAPTDSTVLIQGESGVGKELVARAIHRHSPRKENPFIVVDCTSLHEELLQSELFGHEKGAFTGATALKHGLFEVADTGTIFLDEVGDMSISLQSRLLRVLETGTFRRLGGVKDIRVDVRIIAATNKNLAQEVAAGRFREDLYYRLNVVTISVPPLRERREDIPVLVRYFIEHSVVPGRQKKGISKEALDRLLHYHWPGNVRELKNVIERALILAEGECIEAQDLPSNLRVGLPFLAESGQTEHLSLEEVERRYIAELLKEYGGNRSRVAKILKISERSLYRKIKEYGL